MEKLLTTEEVAKILRIHPTTIRNYIRAGKLKASKVGKAFRITEKDIEQFLAERSSRE